MEILIKIIPIIKVILFTVMWIRYGLNYKQYSQDFDSFLYNISENIEQTVAVTLAAMLGVSEGLKTSTHLLADSAISLFVLFFKTLFTVTVSFYFTKFLKNPPEFIKGTKTKFKTIYAKFFKKTR
jgi:hypothetical protein